MKIGDKIPDFTLIIDKNIETSFYSILNNQKLVLFFYPKDFTPGCTKEACAFRDSYQDFLDNGANVLGISSDSEESHLNFMSDFNLPYKLISDSDGKIGKIFNVKKSLGLLPERVTFIINNDGTLIHSFSSQFNINKHIRKSLEILNNN